MKNSPVLKVLVLTPLALAVWGCAHPHNPNQSSQPQSADALNWLTGKWRGTRLEPSSGDRDPVVSVVRPILGGAGEEEMIEIRTSKNTYRGMYLQATETNGLSVIIYVNANRRHFARLEGKAQSDGGEWLNVAQGSHRARLVYERPSSNTWRRTQYVSEDAGKTWSVLWIDNLERRR